VTDPGGWAARLRDGACQALERELSTSELAAFDAYIDLLVTWQGVHRLLGSRDPRWIVDELILDSLLFVRLLPGSGRSLLDLGSGAGIPGIPIGIVRPDLRLALLEVRRRRASFLSTAIRRLGLTRAEVIPLRAEEALAQRPELAGGFDAVVSRCAGEIRLVIRLAAPFLAQGGRLIVSGPPSPRGGGPPGQWVTLDRPQKARPRTFFVLDSLGA
jgi:16S rRNA (guanine527-N7)-methyltransferase